MENTLYDYRPITERAPIHWPDGKRVAFYIGLNVEHFHLDKPSTSIIQDTSTLLPDALNYGWRDYGVRVGIWRLIESMDRHGIRPSVLLNSEVAQHYPQIIEAGRRRDWAWLAHGRTNSVLHTDLEPEAELAELTEIVETIQKATGQRPLGWMGPALTETLATPRLLADLGLQYVLDWTADDQPFALNVPGMLSVPYTVELNDLGIFGIKGFTGPDFLQMFTDHLDQLVEDSADSGRVMALALHPFVIGQPSRHKYLDQALEYAANHPDVWLTTSDEIAGHYSREVLGTIPQA
ncbi:Polysaccharide deacetylase [Actinopolymorpha cephalotaxi]|nr:polysaccharide deacetylase family protein [Actinopolymorpha cephalotaxi]SFH11236.1 Polysaccharide deacetylase [Actinopolymorpha cephalotaxi]